MKSKMLPGPYDAGAIPTAFSGRVRHSRPSWETYHSLLKFAEVVRRDQKQLGARDMIDIQSFLWVQGSDEYD